jgi:hypothetical protein
LLFMIVLHKKSAMLQNVLSHTVLIKAVVPRSLV